MVNSNHVEKLQHKLCFEIYDREADYSLEAVPIEKDAGRLGSVYKGKELVPGYKPSTQVKRIHLATALRSVNQLPFHDGT